MTINPFIIQAAPSGGGGGPDLTGLVDRSITDLDLSGFGDTGSIGDYAFYNCTALASLTLPAGLTGPISDYAFSGCSSLTSLTLPAGLTGNIGLTAFRDCTSLTSLDVPAGITSIGTTSSSSRVFYNCTALEYLIFRSTSVVTLGNISSLQGTTCLFYVPADLVDAYKTANNWSTVADRIFAIPEELL